MPRTAILFGHFQRSIEDVVAQNMADRLPDFYKAVDNAARLAAFARQDSSLPLLHITLDEKAGTGNNPDQYVTSVQTDISSTRSMLRSMCGLLTVESKSLLDQVQYPSSASHTSLEQIWPCPGPNPFHDTKLVEFLREKGIVQVIICGVATTGVVLSSLQGALDVGLQPIVISDACMDPDPELHTAMLS